MLERFEFLKNLFLINSIFVSGVFLKQFILFPIVLSTSLQKGDLSAHGTDQLINLSSLLLVPLSYPA
jgi:hypothetical protein